MFLPTNPELGHPEHHEYRWLPYLKSRSVLEEHLKPILAWAEKAVERGGLH